MQRVEGKINVLIVDDSPMMRKMLKEILLTDKKIHVMGSAPNGKIALAKLALHTPDVITLDLEMPHVDGLTTLKEIMSNNPIPVLIVSSHTTHGAKKTLLALSYGAVDFVTKPDAKLSRTVMDVADEIVMKIKAVNKAKIKRLDIKKVTDFHSIEQQAVSPQKRKAILDKNISVIAIGISTGGPEALAAILPTIPPDIKAGILIVQHMPIGFTKVFAERMNKISEIEVLEAANGTIIAPGRVIIAKGGFHMVVKEQKFAHIIRLNQNARVSLFRPSIDVMMESVAENFGNNSIGVIMTGMGYDGCEGIAKIQSAGGFSIAQDKSSSVVFGMNKTAIAKGYIEKVVPLKRVVPLILERLEVMEVA